MWILIYKRELNSPQSNICVLNEKFIYKMGLWEYAQQNEQTQLIFSL